MVFGNSEDVSGIPPSSAEKAVTKIMQEAWMAFANNTGGGLTEYGWPAFDLTGDTIVRLGYDNSAFPDLVSPSLYSGDCEGVELGGG